MPLAFHHADPAFHRTRRGGGGPPLAAEPYVVERLDDQLARAAYRFVNAREYNFVDSSTKRVELSRLFVWYRGDFERKAGSLEKFLRPFAMRPDLSDALDAANFSVHYRPFDWRLNAAAAERPVE